MPPDPVAEDEPEDPPTPPDPAAEDEPEDPPTPPDPADEDDPEDPPMPPDPAGEGGPEETDSTCGAVSIIVQGSPGTSTKWAELQAGFTGSPVPWMSSCMGAKELDPSGKMVT